MTVVLASGNPENLRDLQRCTKLAFGTAEVELLCATDHQHPWKGFQEFIKLDTFKQDQNHGLTHNNYSAHPGSASSSVLAHFAVSQAYQKPCLLSDAHNVPQVGPKTLNEDNQEREAEGLLSYETHSFTVDGFKNHQQVVKFFLNSSATFQTSSEKLYTRDFRHIQVWAPIHSHGPGWNAGSRKENDARGKCFSCLGTSDSLQSMDCSPPGSSVHGILQARKLEWVAIPFSRVSSQPRDQTRVSHIAGRFFTIWATGEVPIPAEDKVRGQTWIYSF